MNVDRKSFLLTFAVLVLAFAGSSTASAQSLTSCNATVPEYSPDFSLNQACLTLNGENYDNPSTTYPSFQSPIVQPPPNFSNVSTVLRLTPNFNYQGGSAWFQTPQPVSSPFTTTFTFQLNPAQGADGIALVIQNSGLTALGPTGCGEGFAGDVAYPPGCTPISANSETQTGITNSIAFRFDSYSQGVGGGTQTNDPGVNNVSIQSCPNMAANSITADCQLAVYPFSQVDFADGNIHTATITYVLIPTTSQTACTGPCLDVNLDGTDLFPAGVPFDMTTLGLTSGTAYVGFTGATGGVTDNQDILSWTFAPQGQTQTVTTGQTTTYSFADNAYNYTAQLTSGSPTTTTVTPIYPNTPSFPYSCDTLVQETYPGAHCVIYTNLGTGIQDSPVMFEVTCPNLPYDQCNPFSATLGTSYALSSQNSLNSCVNTNSCNGTPTAADPFPGWVKFAGPNSLHPCTPPQSGTLVESNQISSFVVDTITRGGSGGTGSCWIPTYDMPQCTSPNQQNCEALTGITISAPTSGLIVAAGQTVPTSYSCANPASSVPNITNNLPSGPVGPYLVAASCTQSTGTGSCTQTANGLSCTGSFTAPSQPGTYQFTVTGSDSGENGTTQTVNYTVVAPTNLFIVNGGPPGPIANGGYITYGIDVLDLGPVNADGVVVTDQLPANTTFVSGSGTNVSCGIVNKKLSCSTTAIQCSANGSAVTCNVGTLAPLSISDLNDGAMTIKVQVTAEPTTTCGTKPCTINTATVSAINTDTNSNPSSTVKTTW